MGQRIRSQISEGLGLTASCGVACNKLLAKICCEMNKPNGSTYLSNSVDQILRFMLSQPVRKIPGIGKINEMILSGIEINSCRDVIEKATEIYINLAPNAFRFLV